MADLGTYTFGYNEEEAISTDPQSNYIKESGVYEGKIVTAMLCSGSGESKAWGVEFTFKSYEGAEANYLRLWCATKKGSFTWQDKNGNHRPLPGLAICQSLMGLLGLKQMRPKQGQSGIGFPDFFGKEITLALQKVLYTKNDNTDGYKFDIIRAFEYRTRMTLSEKKSGKEAKIQLMEIKDKDERTGGQSQGNQYGQSKPVDGVDEDLPF